MFKSRILPGALILVITLGAILLSRVSRVAFFAVLAVMSAFELKAVFGELDVRYLHWIPVVYIIGQALLCWFSAEAFWMLLWFALAAFASVFSVVLKPSLGAKSAVFDLFGMLWPFFFYGLILCVAASERWLSALILGILGTWICDSVALFVGRAVGKRKLAPSVSPNKTWAGTIGGALAAPLGGLILYFPLRAFGGPSLGVCMASTFVCSCFGQAGDLVASLIKRMCGVKDYSRLIGEHGGILDKMDGMLFSLPAAWCCLYCFGLLGL